MLTSTRTGVPSARRRAGLTLIELLVVIVLLGIVAGGMLKIINQQQRYYTGSSGIIETRQTVRQGIDVLQSEMRALSPGDTDIYAIGSNFIEIRANEGSSVICSIDAARTTIVVPPGKTLSSGATLTSWVSGPEGGDSLLVQNWGTKPGASDDKWERIQVTGPATPGGSCAPGTAFTQTDPITGVAMLTSSEAAQGWTLTLASDKPLPGSVAIGAPIRLFRRVRYELYQASDRKWYLGYQDCVTLRTPVCTTLQPVAGPYVSPTNAQPGLAFAYFDSTGAATTDRFKVRRIDIVMHARSNASMDVAGHAPGFYDRSLSTSVTVRN
ncbi:MAG TPA: prepilin-type N-terminal cleavage/methylation domain-containing protein [Gemmatimonadaceae bacterium]